MNVEVEVVSDDSIRVSWESIDLPEIVGYIVYYNSVSGRTNEASTKNVSSSILSTIISGLMSGEIYYFQVSAVADGDIKGRKSLIDGASVTIIHTRQMEGNCILEWTPNN